jgi:hypothetical protein
MRVRTAAAASAIWVIGVWLRLSNLNMMEFKSDERVSLELAIQLLGDHPWSSAQPFPSHGLISSNNIGNAPLFTWIVAPLWALTHHPVGVTALIAVINALCLLPLWFWAQRRMDEHRALLTLAIAAVSPFAVLFSRKIWPVDLLLPGLLAVLWSIEWQRDGRFWRAVALAGAGVLLLTQLHQSGVITAPLLLVAFVVQWIIDARRGIARPPARPTLAEASAVIFVVAANLFFWWTYLPYLRTVPPEVFTLRPVAPSYRPQLLFNVISEVAPRHLLSPFFVEHLLFTADSVRAGVYFAALTLGAPLAAYGLWRWLRNPLALPVAGLWWWLIIVAFTLARIPSHDYYVLAVMPLPIVLAAGAFDGRLSPVLDRVITAWRWVYVAALLALTVVTGLWLERRGGSRGDYGVSFAIQQTQAQTLLEWDRRTGTPAAPQQPELRPDQRALLTCHAVSYELVWLTRWIDDNSSTNFRSLRICDGWIATGDDAVYRWVINPVP